MSDDTVRLELEIGAVELEYEGPATFARENLVEVVRGLADALETLSMGDYSLDEEIEAMLEAEAEADEAALRAP